MMSARKLAVLVVVCLAVAALASAANQPVAPQSPPVMTMDGVHLAPVMDRAAYAAFQARTHQWLMSEQVPEGLTSPVVVPRNEAKLAEIAPEAAQGRADSRGRERVGYSEGVGVQLGTHGAWADQLSRRALDLSHGAVRATDDGFVYTAAVRSPGARGLRLHLTDVMLPEGAELWVYGPAEGAHGPYTFAGPGGSGDFWTNTIWSETVIVQVRYSGYELDRALGASSFRVADLAYIATSGVRGPSAVYQATSLCTGNADCVRAASGGEGWNEAIALIYFVDGRYWYICSGGALNDAAPGGAPYYFLTANHCISRDRSAGTLEAYWDFTPNSCGTAGCDGPCASVPMSSGASVAATNKTGDYTLLSLDSAPPLGAYMGWDANPVYDVDGYSLQRLSHPQGSPQAYSTHSVDTSPPAVCSSWPRGPWIYSHDVSGATEGGSSGSPVLNSDKKVVGQLSGGCGYNVNDVCDNTNNSTVDGAFASYYADVAGLLGGGGGGTNQPPTASFTYFCSGLDCTFDGSGSSDSDGTVASYEWSFGDGGSATGATPSHSYAAGGTYGVTLVVTDDGGATGSASQNVTVDGGSQCVPSGGACATGADCCSGRCHPKKGYCQ